MIETDGMANLVSEGVPQIINIEVPIEPDLPA
jgi:hypothetical protein